MHLRDDQVLSLGNIAAHGCWPLYRCSCRGECCHDKTQRDAGAEQQLRRGAPGHLSVLSCMPTKQVAVQGRVLRSNCAHLQQQPAVCGVSPASGQVRAESTKTASRRTMQKGEMCPGVKGGPATPCCKCGDPSCLCNGAVGACLCLIRSQLSAVDRV